MEEHSSDARSIGSCCEAGHLGHGVAVGLLLGVGPVDDDVAAEDLDAPGAEPALGERGGLVRIVLEEAEAPVLSLVIWRTVNDHLRQAGCSAKREHKKTVNSSGPLGGEKDSEQKKRTCRITCRGGEKTGVFMMKKA